MGEFKRNGGFGGNKNRGGFGGKRDGGRGGFGGRPSFGSNRDERRSEMFTATCDNCGRQCEVPFRPSGSKPVYCDNCFSAKRDGQSNGFAGNRPSRRQEQRDTFTFGAPTEKEAPVRNNGEIAELKKQIDTLSAKVDKLLNLAQSNAQTKPTAVAEAPKATTKTATATPEKVATKKTAKTVTKKEVTKSPATKKATAKKK